ncbi:hypothetical protein [Streptomyces sp. F-1]|uniref:hypothetical protein n=1 Tax=Streptomyces sp. F-1 TaxID=463642 RepID=UPI001160FE74|nr:hypothetical protein [Streptomyces sp. F-1]
MANWTPVDGDWNLVANKSEATRLGFSLLLKFIELEGWFPLLGPGPARRSVVAEDNEAGTSRLTALKRDPGAVGLYFRTWATAFARTSGRRWPRPRRPA